MIELKNIFDFLVLLTWLALKYFVKPVRRAFLCSDLSLYHPPPIKKVFPTWLLFVCAIVVPLIVVCSLYYYFWLDLISSIRFYFPKVFVGFIYFDEKLRKLFIKFEFVQKFMKYLNGSAIFISSLVFIPI